METMGEIMERSRRLEDESEASVARWKGEIVKQARRCLDSISDEDRLSLFREYCHWCGANNPRCNCMRDE